MLTVIRGAGDIATGVALRLWRAGIRVVMTDLAEPSSIRRTVCFSEAVRLGETRVEDVTARAAGGPEEALALLEAGQIPVLADPAGRSSPGWGRRRWWTPFWPSGTWGRGSRTRRRWWE